MVKWRELKKIKPLNLFLLTIAGVIMIIECRNTKKCFDKPILSALAKLNL